MFWLLAAASRRIPLFASVLTFLSSSASFAQAPAAVPAAGGDQPSMLMSLVPFIFIFAIMYFLVLRPQGRRQKDHQKFLGELKRGDEVITASGLLGRIEGMTDQIVTLEIADGVRVKMMRTQVAGSSRAAITALEAKKGTNS